MTDYTDVPRDEKGDVLRVGTAFWDNAHQPQLLEAVALEYPREEDEGVLDYAERIAVEGCLLPISKHLRERNRLRYADRMPRGDDYTPTVRRIEQVLEEDLVKPHLAPPTADRTQPHEHYWEDISLVGKPEREFVCDCGARRIEEPTNEEPPVEPGDRIPDHKPVPDSDDEWF